MKLLKKEEEKNHVGRPTNEEVKVRRNKKLLKVFVPISIAVVLIVGTIIMSKGINVNKLSGSAYKYPSVAINLDSFQVLNYSDKKGQCLITAARYKDVGTNISRIELNGKEIGGSATRFDYSYPKKLKRKGNYYIADIDSGFRMYLPENSKFQFTVTTYATNKYGYNDKKAYQAKFTFNISKGCVVVKKSFDGSNYYTSNMKENGLISSNKSASAKTGLKISCPSSAKVGQQFTCKTNASGVKLSSTTSGLASGYNASFTTTSGDKTIQRKFTRAGTVTITASKSGYKSVSKKVKIVNSSSNSGSNAKPNASKTTLTGSCRFTNVSTSASGIHHYVKYSTSCSGNAKVTNIAYKTPVSTKNRFVNRGSGWGSVKGGTSTIDFHARNVGKQATLRLYYDTSSSSKSTSHYSDYNVTIK